MISFPVKDLKRRDFVKKVGLGAAGVAVGTGLSGCMATEKRSKEMVSEQNNLTLYIGTYTSGASKGIYRGLFDTSTGELTDVKLAASAVNPSFLAVHPMGKMVLAVNEVTDFNGASSGAISAYEIQDNGMLSLLSQQGTEGGAPCYVTTDAAGRWAFVANYVGGNATVFPVGDDGLLGVAASIVQHEGSSVNKDRQAGPHAHCIELDPAGHFAFVADLGLDKIMVYALDAESGILTPNSIPSVSTAPGAGPRHFTFHPEGGYAFVINELDSTMTVFSYNATNGSLEARGTVSTLPADFDGTSYCADIHVHPNGRFVYGSNRGHDSIFIASFDLSTGMLKPVGHESTQGSTPRNFTLDPTGQFLLVANQRSDNIVIYDVDQESGLLAPTGQVVETPTPVCLKFV